jgi:hypothetical protein
MDNFEYTFINAKIDQQIYTDILNTVFQQERGYTLHDCKKILLTIRRIRTENDWDGCKTIGYNKIYTVY